MSVVELKFAVIFGFDAVLQNLLFLCTFPLMLSIFFFTMIIVINLS